MYCSKPFTEYITILPIRVTGGSEGGLLLRQLRSVQTLTPFTTLRYLAGSDDKSKQTRSKVNSTFARLEQLQSYAA